MSSKSLTFACFSAAVGAMVAASSLAQSAEVLRFNRWIPQSHFFQRDVLEVWANDVERLTKGNVKVEMTASSLGSPRAQYQMAVDGVADITWGSTAYTPGQFKLTTIVDLPFLSDSVEAISVTYWNIYTAELMKAGEFKETKLLALHTPGAGVIFTDKRPITRLEDFKGLKIRISAPSMARFLKGVDAAPSFIAMTEVREALSKGVIDGATWDLNTLASMGGARLVKHALQVPGGFYRSSFFLVMNKKKWDALSAADQKAIDLITGVDFSKRSGRGFDKHEALAAKKLVEDGVKMTVAQGQFLSAIKSQFESAEMDWIKIADSKGFNGAAILAKFKQAIASYKPQQ